MKILALGDFHGKFPTRLKNATKKADLILCTGDLGGSDSLLKIIFKYFGEGWWKKVGKEKAREYVLEDYNNGKEILKQLSKINNEVYLINGNWDFTSTSLAERTAGLKLDRYSKLAKKEKNLHLHNRAYKKIRGLNILFFGGYVTAGAYLQKGVRSDKKRKKYLVDNSRETKQIMKYVKKPVDILFIHYPPYGHFDVVKYKGENPMNGKHVGFKGYTEFIKKNNPKLVICGHMHEYQGKKKVGKTTIVATGSAKEGKAAWIDFDEHSKEIKDVKFIS